MLKLCLALPIFYPTFGGGPLRILRAQSGLRKREVHARVLAGTARSKDDSHSTHGDDRDSQDWPIGSMLPIEHIDGIPVHRVRLPSATGVQRTSTYFRALLALCEDPATRPDVIQLHSFERVESLYWLRRLRKLEIPIVHAIQIARPVRRGSSAGRFFERRFRRAFYKGFDAVLTNSDAIRSTLSDWSVPTPVRVVPNGVDLARFGGDGIRFADDATRLADRADRFEGDAAPFTDVATGRGSDADDRARSRARVKLGIEQDGPLVLGVGAICPRKGSDLLVEAWTKLLHRHPGTRLVLVGPRHDLNNPNLADFSERLHQSIANSRRPDQIHLMGIRDDMHEVYAAADVVVLASSREGMPNSVLEAMACRRPVLLTPFLGQSKHLGRPGREYLQCERSADALAENLARVFEDHDLRVRLVGHGREWVERNLDLESNLDELAEFYRWAANRRTRPHTMHSPGGGLCEFDAVPEASSVAVGTSRRDSVRQPREPSRCDVLFLTDRRFWRRSIGSEQRIANLLLHLERRGVAVTAAHVGHVGRISPAARQERAALDRFRREAPGLRILTRPTHAKSVWPASSASVRRDFVRSVIDRHAPGIVIVEFLRLTHLVFPRPRIDTNPTYWIDTHDVMHRRTERFRDAGLAHDRDLDVDEEKRLLDTYDAILAIQSLEAEQFRRLLPRKEVIVVPHGLSMPEQASRVSPPDAKRYASPALARTPADTLRVPKRIGYLGGGGAANRHALDWFVREVWPAVRARFGDAVELHVAGGICGEWRCDRAGVVAIGRVESIDDFWPRIDIAINPARVGSGLKIKNVEALAWGRPLVTTPIGAEGLEDASSGGLRIADQAHEWVRILETWLSDPIQAAEAGRRGRAHATSRLTPERAFRELDQKISHTLAGIGR